MPATFHEIAGSAHYEFRYEDGDHLTTWQDAGHVSPACLDEIKTGLKDATYWEVRVVVSLARDNGEYAGLLTLTERIEGGTEFEAGL